MNTLYICNIENPISHCIHYCPCGQPHIPDHCTKIDYCGIVDQDTKCRKLTDKELKMWEKSK